MRRFKAEIFQGLAHPTCIAIVDLLRERAMTAGEITRKLRLEQANASQHLAVLRSRRILLSRKEGTQVFYSVRDPALIEVLDLLRGYFYSQVAQTMSMLKKMRAETGDPLK